MDTTKELVLNFTNIDEEDFVGFHHVWSLQWPFKLSQMLRRKPALKNEKGEYN